MLKTESPWILNLQRDREKIEISTNEETDIAVVGGGVSGMMVAYFLLQETNNRVIILEKDALAHGASGHNAGQAVAAFEVPYKELINRYGQKITDNTYAAINDAFTTLHNIAEYAGVEVIDTEALASFLDINSAKERLQTPGSDTMYVPVGTEVDGATILKDFDETVWSSKYAAAVSYHAGILNCPALLESMAKRLLNENKGRFQIYENSEVDEIDVYENSVSIKCNDFTVQSKYVVLCTNGYAVPAINADALDLNVQPVAGYIIGRMGRQAETNVRSYLPADSNDPYYYITRRSMNKGSLACIGGLDTKINDWKEIENWTEEDNHKCSTIETFFLQDLTGFSGPRNYQWKGLMGYTGNNVRVAGRDPYSPQIFYSIGCNGIGILPSIASAEIICNQIMGEESQKTFFEPLIQRPEITGNPAAAQLFSPPSRE